MTFLCWTACLAGLLISAEGRLGAKVEPIPPLSEVTSISVSVGHGGWTFGFLPDGSVHAQYGSLPWDSANLPVRTVKFDALLDAVRRLQVAKKARNDTQVAVARKGSSTSYAFYLSDDTLFCYLLASFHEKWKPQGDRFHQLLKSYPIYGR